MEAAVILQKCGKNKGVFGVRVEKTGQSWARTWAFPIEENRAKREGFQKTRISGTFVLDPNYPGCPYCGSMGICKCGCGKLGCYDGEKIYTCPWCGSSGEVAYTNEFELVAGQD